MNLTEKQIAEAFSTHEFKSIYSYFSDKVKWKVVGKELLHGREAVISSCEQSSNYLANITTEFKEFKVIADGDCVVIDSLAEYIDQEQNTSRISSCDIYEFVGEKLSVITSYCVEL